MEEGDTEIVLETQNHYRKQLQETTPRDPDTWFPPTSPPGSARARTRRPMIGVRHWTSLPQLIQVRTLPGALVVVSIHIWQGLRVNYLCLNEGLSVVRNYSIKGKSNFSINLAKYSVQRKRTNNTAVQNTSQVSLRLLYTSMEAISQGLRYAGKNTKESNQNDTTNGG